MRPETLQRQRSMVLRRALDVAQARGKVMAFEIVRRYANTLDQVPEKSLIRLQHDLDSQLLPEPWVSTLKRLNRRPYA